MNPYSALKHGIKLIKKYPILELCVTTLDEIYTVCFVRDNFLLKCKKSFFQYELPIETVMRLLLEWGINEIEIYGSVRIVYLNKILYNHKAVFVEKIIKAYRRYRLKTARIRNDLVLHGLAEYWYHPSKLSFDEESWTNEF